MLCLLRTITQSSSQSCPKDKRDELFKSLNTCAVHAVCDNGACVVLIVLNLRVVLVVSSFVIVNFYGEKNLVTKIEV